MKLRPICLALVMAPLMLFAAPAKGGKGNPGSTFAKPDFAFPESVEKNARAVLDKSLPADPENAIKALLQIIIAKSQVSNDSFAASMRLCDSVAGKLQAPWRQIVRSLQAQSYNSYYDENSYRIEGRSLPLDAEWPENVNEWSKEMFSLKVQELTSESLASPVALQSVPLSRIKGLLTDFDNRSEAYLPSVYDLLAWRGVEYLDEFAARQTVIPFAKDPSQVSSPAQKASVMRDQIYPALEKANADHPYALAYAYTQQDEQHKGKWLYDKYLTLKDTPAALVMLFSLDSYVPRFVGDKPSDTQAPITRKEYYTLCSEALKRFPQSDYAKAVENILHSMRGVSVRVTPGSTSLVGKPVTAEVTAENISDFHLLLVRVNTDGKDSWTANSKVLAGKVVGDQPVHVAGEIPFRDTVRVTFPAVGAGYYAMVASSSLQLKDAIDLPARSNSQLIRIGSLSAFYTNLSNSHIDPKLYVVDANESKPVKGVTVNQYANYYPDRNKLLQAGTTDAEGAVRLGRKNERVEVKRGNEIFSLNSYVYNNWNEAPQATNVKVLTDLALYHPGDSVGIAAILYRDTEKAFAPVAGKTLQALLYNVNGEEVDSLNLKTDEFGRASGRMLLPKDGVLGNCRVVVRQGKNAFGSQPIMVAEYKAPTFFVELDTIAPEFKPGQDIRISGLVKTYSGMPVGGAKVSIKVDYRPLFWWWFDNDNASYGQDTVADAYGRFSFSLPTKNLEGTRFATGVFAVSATAVSPAGESQQSGSESFCLGHAFRISPSLPSQVCADGNGTLSGPVDLLNAADKAQPAELTYKMCATDGKVVKEGSFMAPSFSLPLSDIPSGEYTFDFVMKSDPSVKTSDKVVIFRSDDKQPPYPTQIWLPESLITAPADASKVKVTVGNSFGGALLCQVVSDTTLVSTKWIYPDGRNIQVEVPAPKDGKKVFVTFISVHDFQPADRTVTIQSISDTEELQVQVETFRDKIRPGTEETWTFRFRNTVTGNPGRIPVLAVMSDKALNAIYDFNWNFSPGKSYTQPLMVGRYTLPHPIWTYDKTTSRGRYFTFIAPKINTYGTPLFDGYRMYERPMPMMAAGVRVRGVRNEMKMESAPVVQEEESADLADSGAKMKQAATGTLEEVVVSGNGKPNKEEIRPIECPLAFFDPSLVSDKEGRLDVVFRVPDFNTTWQFQLLGYDTDMRTAKTKLFSVASKPVMVQSLAPRFLRTGDDAQLRATLYNNTDKAQTLTGVIEILEPLTGNVLSRVETVAADVPAHGSRVIALPYTVPTDVQTIAVRSRAQAGNFADVEQALVGILPSSSPVTESTDFYLDPKQNDFSVKLPDYKSGNITLQYCDNPVWYCLTALPDISTPESDNLLSLIYAYYGNALSMGLANKYPKIGQALRLWNADKANSPLVSNLQKNAELKTIALSNTIWLNNASAETLRMSRLIDLLDSAANRAAQASLIRKMQGLQTSSGGWQWMPGMDPSLYLSSSVLLYLGQLRQMDCLPGNKDIADMTDHALGFCDKEVLDIYRRSQREKWPFPLQTMLSYFYIRSFYDKPASGDVARLRSLTMRELAKQWRTLDIYDAATAATLLARSGDKTNARLILESLRQKTITAPGKGMWYDNLRSVFTSSGPLICTAQVLEAFSEIEPGAKEIDGLRQWLVLQRQAQDWGRNRNLAEVVYAILTSGTDWTDSSKPSVITLGGKTLEPSRVQALTGEFTMPLDLHKASGAQLTVSKPGSHPAWGGVLSQYIQPMADVRNASVEDLSITKELYVIRTTEAGEQAIKTDKLNVGDRVRVTLTLTVGRDLEYVAVTDERAACLEPADQLPHYVWRQMTGYYYEPRNSQTNLFISHLGKGVHTLTYDCYVQQQGEFALGIATAQSQYAPLIVAHSAGRILTVTEK